jgi:hypothetical protein
MEVGFEFTEALARVSNCAHETPGISAETSAAIPQNFKN